VSAQVSELGMTFAQKSVEGKSNEIPAVQELWEELDIIVAEAFNCQKKTAASVIFQGADYVLNVKDNHHYLKRDIADYVEDVSLRRTMEKAVQTEEKNMGRIEKRSAVVTDKSD